MPRGVKVYIYGTERYGDVCIVYRFRTEEARSKWLANNPDLRRAEGARVCGLYTRRGHGYWKPLIVGGIQFDGERWVETTGREVMQENWKGGDAAR